MALKLYRRRGRPHWILRGTVGGRRIEESTGTADKALAEEIRVRREAELQRARIFGRAATATWAQAVNVYLDHGGSARFLGPLLAHFSTTPLHRIDQAAVDAAARKLYPKAQAATRVRQVYVPTSAVLNAAAERGLCQPVRFRRPKVAKPVRRAVTRAWLTAFLAHAEPRLGALALFGALTGARLGEMVALDWRDVNLPAGEALIVQSKTGTARRVVLAAPLLAALANLPGRDGRVFGYGDRREIYRPWRRACAQAGIAYVPPHQAGRHTFASWLLAAGHSAKLVADAGGWKSPRLVAEVYGHLERSQIDIAVDDLGRNWGADTAPASEPATKTGR